MKKPRPAETVFRAFLEAMTKHGRSARLLEDKNQIEYSYSDLLKTAMALGRLGSRLATRGEMLGVLMPNVAATFNLFLGLNAFGRIPAMLNYTAGIEAVNGACLAAGVRCILTSRAFVEQAELGALIAGLGQYRVVYLEDLRSQFGWLDKLWLIAWATRFPSLACAETGAETEAEKTAVVLFTSGSEGKPKGVALSHRALLANLSQIRAVIPITTSDKFFNALPLFHAFGLTAGTLLPILSGARLVLYPSPLHYKIIPEMIREHRCTVLFGTSTFLAHYARCAGDEDFRSLRCVIAGAECLGSAVRKSWMDRFGIPILEGYGVTEAAPVIAVNTPQDNREGSVGKMMPGMEARIEAIPGIECGGRLHVRGPNLMSGYLRADAPGVLQPPVSTYGSGWHDTGDVVEIDADGFLFIRGRVKRFAKIAGEMISLETAESIAAEAEPTAAHAACCVADAQRGECILLFTTAQGLDRERLLAAARRLGAPEIAVPRRVVRIEEIPLLGSGKTNYVALNNMSKELP